MNKMNSLKGDDVGFIEDFFDSDTMEWCLWYFNQFEDTRFNGMKYVQTTHWDQPFNHWFGDYCQQRVKDFFPEAKIHSIYIGNDVKPGGIHTDGWLYEGEKHLAYKTILIPLKFNVPSSTIVYNEKDDKARTLNEITGLGSHGIENMEQGTLSDDSQIFPKHIHQTHLKHLEYKGLHGLSVHSILDWKPGRALTWNRQRWHGPAYFEGHGIERYHVNMMTHRNAG